MSQMLRDDIAINELTCRAVTIAHAAALLGVKRRSVYNYIKLGRLRTVGEGASRRVLTESLRTAPERYTRWACCTQVGQT